ncbi:hypothetical protein SteCoe_8669 [Stentor coeruleus]|uniref:Amino acid transporter transmembrane domain-containing protein n=1 Tax=Stentor coeruleus TaxID=5963 RepID=A0A1R2CJR4_9CILI|nr:hypothetical protein SteCoe_8669 [Stentor coeruleus]
MDKISNEIPETYSLSVAIIVSLNCFLVGSTLGIPWSFVQSGWAFSLIISLLVLAILYILAIMLLQVLSRMKILHHYSNKGYTIRPVPLKDLFTDKPQGNYIFMENEEEENQKLVIEENEIPKNYKYDFTILCKVLLGRNFEIVFICVLVTTFLVFAMSCTSGFAAAMVSTIPIGPFDTCDIYQESSFYENCRYKYIFYVFIFLLLTMFLSLFFHFYEHKNLQITTCFIRLFMIFLMIGTALSAYLQDKDIDSDNSADVSSKAFNLPGFGVTSAIMYFTIGGHIIIPDLIQPLKNKEKNVIPMITFVLIISWILCITFGLTLSLTVSDIEPQITLNWKNYSNGENPSDREWWAYIVDVVISIFPAIDILSQIFISVTNISDNIIAVTYKDLKTFDVDKSLVFKIRIVIILISTIIPMIFFDLGFLLAITGNLIITFNIFTINPAALASLTLVPQKCPYDNFISKKSFIIVFFIITSAFIVVQWTSFFIFAFAS